MTRFTKKLLGKHLDSETLAAAEALENSFNVTFFVCRGNPPYPFCWTVSKLDWGELEFYQQGYQDTPEDTALRMAAALEEILSRMGETKKSLTIKSKLRGET